ncbi:MAG: hypothetical protein JWP52_1516, partial [Rhizobacter sp.]|nr:hypothetical protein [Rhizobacter sp.]
RLPVARQRQWQGLHAAIDECVQRLLNA